MILVLTGKTATGKSTVINELVEHHGFHKVITYTTRQKRKNEIDGVDYHFVDNNTFQKMIQNKELLEYDCIPQSYGMTYYGSKLEDYEKWDKTVVALTQSGCEKLRNKIIVRLEASDETIYKRLLKRGDKPENIQSRIQKDNEWNLKPDLIILVDDLDVETIISKILDYIKG